MMDEVKNQQRCGCSCPRSKEQEGRRISWQEEPKGSWRCIGRGRVQELEDPAEFLEESLFLSKLSFCKSRGQNFTFQSVHFHFSFLVVVILSPRLISLSIKVCISPEEVAFAMKACE